MPPTKSTSTNVEAAPPDLDADEEGALGVERQRHHRLADPPALRLAAPEQAVGLEVAHDHRHRLRRQPGHPRDLGLGQRPVPADEAQHQPLVLRPHPGLVRARAAAARGASSRAARRSSERIGPLRSGSPADVLAEIINQSDLIIDRSARIRSMVAQPAGSDARPINVHGRRIRMTSGTLKGGLLAAAAVAGARRGAGLRAGRLRLPDHQDRLPTPSS